MKTFEQFILETDNSYLSIGHDFDGNYDSWVLRRMNSDFQFSKEKAPNEDPEYFHDAYPRFAFKGRIDHDKQMVSIVAGNGEEQYLKYVADTLRAKFPTYKIWYFTLNRKIEV